MALTVAQCRAARALLGWSAADLAEAGGFGIVTVKRFEGGHTVSAASIDRMSAALAAAGITFIAAGETSSTGGDGVRLTTPRS
jgi:transcriptional regulator with XRE-family HTH domain